MEAWCAMLCTLWHPPANSSQAVANITIGLPPAEHQPGAHVVSRWRMSHNGTKHCFRAAPSVQKFSSMMPLKVAQRHCSTQ